MSHSALPFPKTPRFLPSFLLSSSGELWGRSRRIPLLSLPCTISTLFPIHTLLALAAVILVLSFGKCHLHNLQVRRLPVLTSLKSAKIAGSLLLRAMTRWYPQRRIQPTKLDLAQSLQPLRSRVVPTKCPDPRSFAAMLGSPVVCVSHVEVVEC